jgi:hypothetical protein
MLKKNTPTHLLRSVDEFTDLQNGGPHRSLTASDGCVTQAIVEELVEHHGATKTKEPELDTTDIDCTGRCLIEDVQVGHSVLSSPEFFEDRNILACAPDSENWDI